MEICITYSKLKVIIKINKMGAMLLNSGCTQTQSLAAVWPEACCSHRRGVSEVQERGHVLGVAEPGNSPRCFL